MSTSPRAATCTRCSTPLNGWTDACGNCGYVAGVGQPAVPAPHPQTALHVVPAKSSGVGVLLSFLWLGDGHLYVGNIGLGVGLIVFDFFLVLFSLIPFVWILTFPVWLIAFIFVAINVSNEANAFNRRNGIVVH